MNELTPGTVVSFELEGQHESAPKPYGYGTVIRVIGESPMIRPDHPLPLGAKLRNITKVR